jgi:hypothetical protein
MKLWEPGQGIVMREVWLNRVYSIFPVRVVQDSSNWTALCLPKQAIALYPHTRDGIPIRIPQDEWVLDGGEWQGGDVLYLVHAGLGYTFTGWWDDDHIFGGWKIDLVEPVRRTPIGFDYMDQLLDIIVSADRLTWYRKDEDELQEAQARAIFTAEQVSDLYQRGERALQMILKNEPPFDRGWETWNPNPAWLVTFDLPQEWDQI